MMAVRKDAHPGFSSFFLGSSDTVDTGFNISSGLKTLAAMVRL